MNYTFSPEKNFTSSIYLFIFTCLCNCSIAEKYIYSILLISFVSNFDQQTKEKNEKEIT